MSPAKVNGAGKNTNRNNKNNWAKRAERTPNMSLVDPKKVRAMDILPDSFWSSNPNPTVDSIARAVVRRTLTADVKNNIKKLMVAAVLKAVRNIKGCEDVTLSNNDIIVVAPNRADVKTAMPENGSFAQISVEVLGEDRVYIYVGIREDLKDDFIQEFNKLGYPFADAKDYIDELLHDNGVTIVRDIDIKHARAQKGIYPDSGDLVGVRDVLETMKDDIIRCVKNIGTTVASTGRAATTKVTQCIRDLISWSLSNFSR